MKKRLKILVSVYACSPVRGSEPGMGWGFVEAISKYHDLWVITEKEKFQAEIESELDKRPELRGHIKFFYITKTRHRTLRKIWPTSYYWFYKTWQKKAYALSKELQAKTGFDAVHQLNMVGFREPGYLWKLDAPFVWGPVGGLALFPWRFLPVIGLYGMAFYIGRNIMNLLHMHLLQRPRKAAVKAQGNIIAATPDTKNAIRKLWGEKSELICEVGPPVQNAQTFSGHAPYEPLRLVWSGQHTPGKALNLLLEALFLVSRDVKWHLHILGNGTRTRAWKNLAKKKGIDNHCTWHGWLPKEKAFSIVRQGHVFVIASLADLTSTVVLEALSQGLPVICLDHCGFADVITDECGIKIPVRSPKQVASDMALAVERLWHDESYRQQLAHGALRRVSDFAWDKKARKVDELYQRAISIYHDRQYA